MSHRLTAVAPSQEYVRWGRMLINANRRSVCAQMMTEAEMNMAALAGRLERLAAMLTPLMDSVLPAVAVRQRIKAAVSSDPHRSEQSRIFYNASFRQNTHGQNNHSRG